jgi:hypothetical protein
LALALSLSLGCSKKPKWRGHDPSASASSATPVLGAPSSSAERPDPVEALHQRTYFIDVDGDLVHAGTTAGVVTWDVSDPAEPRRVGSLVLRGSVHHIAKVPDTPFLAVATGPSGLALVDVREARDGKLVLVNPHPWTAEARKVCHAVWRVVPTGPKAGYLACGAGVAHADFSDPAKPVIDKHTDINGYARDVAVLDARKVLVAAGRAGLAIADFGGPEAKVVERLELNAEARGVEVREGLAYVAAGEEGLVIVDVSGTSLRVVGKLLPKTTDMARGIALSGSHALLCIGDSGLAVIDVSDPAKPTEVGRFDPKGAVNRVTVSGARLFVANDSDGVAILDISKPSEPKQVVPAK